MVDDLGKVLVKNTYQLAHILGESFFDVTQKQVIDWFKILGLPVYHWEKVAENIDEVIKICTSEETKQYFESQEIEFDGLVIKVNELFTWPLL
jgi:NAD-dependent DNA ligase